MKKEFPNGGPRMTRRAFSAMVAAAAVEPALAAPSVGVPSPAVGFRSFSERGDDIRITVPSLRQSSRVMVVGDTHFALDDARGEPYLQYSRRMGGGYAKEKFEKGAAKVFDRLIAEAKAKKVDLLALVGDIVSFPSEAGVEWTVDRLNASGLAWTYVAGNHDWHYEGVPGSSSEQRAEWTAKRLSAFYRGANPLMQSVLVKGVRWVFVDNSTYEILPEQLAFWEAEAAKGEPVVLAMHIPLWVNGMDVVRGGCAHPDWGFATDPHFQIERRQRWPERHSATTFAFRRSVVGTTNLVGVFAGHAHERFTGQDGNMVQFVTAAAGQGRRLLVDVGS